MSIDHGKVLAEIEHEITAMATKVDVTVRLGRASNIMAKVRALAQPAEAVEGLTVENAPFETRAPAFGGGYWHKVEHGWKWCTGSTFPRPGGDWTGELIPPAHDAAQGAVAWRFWMDESESWLKPGWSEWSADSKFRLLCDSLGYRAEFAYPATHPQAAPAQESRNGDDNAAR